jgi:hypothetical protein
MPNAATMLVKNVKKTIRLDNLMESKAISGQFEGIVRSATKEWLEEEHHYWEAVDRHYSMGCLNRQQILLWGKELGKDNLFNQSLSVKYLYNYFEGDIFPFDTEDMMIASTNCH